MNTVIPITNSEGLSPSDGATARPPEGERDGPPALRPSALIADIVYEDDYLLVVDKPAGVAVHFGQGRRSGTLVDALMEKYPQLSVLGPRDRPGIVHRIDMDTSGLLVVALTKEITDKLSSAIRERRVSRRYVALVDGIPERSAAIVEGPIGRDQTDPTRRAIDPYGRPARTRYAVVRSYGKDGRRVSLLHVKLETGRMHQIRVHLRGIGHPVIGDHTYKGRRTVMGLQRQFLHACQLEFQHPVTNETMSFDSDLPHELKVFIDGLTAMPEAMP